jgi:hypothetical protein
MTNEQFTPSVDLTIFPRINYLKQFVQRADLRARNGRIFNWAYVSLIDDVEYYPPADGSTCIDSLFPKDLGPNVATTPTNLFDLRDDCGSPSTYDLQTGDNTIAPGASIIHQIGDKTLTAGQRTTLTCAAAGEFEIIYTWQFRKADDSGYTALTASNIANEYPGALFPVLDLQTVNEPGSSSVILTWLSGSAPSIIRCLVKDRRSDGIESTAISTSNITYN